MQYSRDIITQAANDWGIETNSHIKGKKAHHYNVVRNFSLSAFVDPEKAKKFIEYVKHLHRGGKGKNKGWQS